MTHANPPRSLETLLVALLPARDRDTISGDLLELYREDHLPRKGRNRANLWYARQVIGFAPRRFTHLPPTPRLLAAFCVFTALSGTWLGIMDLVLKHPANHEIISVTIVLQALLTLGAIALRDSWRLRVLALGGSAGILYLGLGALVGVLTGTHFEGYILLIALGLILQALLTILTLMRRPTPPELRNQPL